MGVETLGMSHRFRVAPWMTNNARSLRREMTDAERLLWRYLRRRQMAGCRFRSQHPVGSYVADFICLEARLIIELDGGQHAGHQRHDQQRTDWLQGQGYRVARFWNNEVLANIDGVMERIACALQQEGRPSS